MYYYAYKNCKLKKMSFFSNFQNLRGLVMSSFNWGIYVGIGLSFPVGRYITALNAWDLVCIIVIKCQIIIIVFYK